MLACFFKDVQSFSTTIVGRLIVNDKDGNLVSDEGNGIHANRGVTLPDGIGATHGVWLSPLFMNRIGHTISQDMTVMLWRGLGIYLRSVNAGANGLAYFFSAWTTETQPSNSDVRYYAIPLRCLVSTKRQASE